MPGVGSDAVGGGVPVPVPVPVVGVPSPGEDRAAVVTVAGVVGPELGSCVETLQAVARSSTPTTKAAGMVRRTDVPTDAHLLRHIHCRATDSGLG